MPIDPDSKKIEQEAKQYYERQMREAKKGGAAARDFYSAAEFARRSAELDQLLPATNQNGDYVYSPQQAFKAACHAREDVTAILVIQRAQLDRLDRNRSLLWIAIGLAAYIAYQVT